MNIPNKVQINSQFQPFWIFFALLVLFVGAALPTINPVTPRLNSDLFAFLGLAVFGWVTHVQCAPSADEPQIELNALAALSGLWFLWACVQYIAGVNTSYFSHFLVSVSYLLALVLLCICVRMWVAAGRASELTQAVLTCVLIAGLLQASGIWLQMFQVQDWLSPWLNKSASFPRQGGFLSQPNLCATLMVASMVSLIFNKPAPEQHSAAPTLWRLVAMGFMMVAVYATSSRTGYLEILIISGILALARQRLKISWVWVALFAWLLLTIGLGELLASQGLISGQLLEDSQTAVMGSSSHRVRILKDAWLVMQAHPLMGVGWRELQVTEVLTPGIQEPVDHAHNLLVQIQLELGVFGTLTLLAFGGYLLFISKPWQHVSGERAAMLCVVVVLLIHSMLEFPLWHALFLFLFGFAASLLLNDTYRLRGPWFGLQVISVCLFALTTWFYIDHQRAVAAYERFLRDQSKEALIASNADIWWNRLLFESIFMINTPVNDNTRPILRRIAIENANVYSQSAFLNLPLLEIMIQDGETAIANQMAARACANFPSPNWHAVLIHLQTFQDPRYQAWLAQLPPAAQNCKN